MRARTWTLALVVAASSAPAWAPPPETDASSSQRRAGRREALPPIPKNIFFPARAATPSPAAGPTAPAPNAGEFVLSGTILSDTRKSALLEYPGSGRLRWVGVGERVGTLVVADITPEGVVFRLGGEQLALDVGRPGADLLAGRRVLGGGFELVGVCRGEKDLFALVQLDGADRAQRVNLNDRLGDGVVVEISADGIVLRVAGGNREVLVGGRYAVVGAASGDGGSVQ